MLKNLGKKINVLYEKAKPVLKIIASGINQFTNTGYRGYVYLVLLAAYQARILIFPLSTLFGFVFGKLAFAYNLAPILFSKSKSDEVQKISDTGFFLWNMTLSFFSILLTAGYSAFIATSFLLERQSDDDAAEFSSYYPVAAFVTAFIMAFSLMLIKIRRSSNLNITPTNIFVKSVLQSVRYSSYFFFLVRVNDAGIFSPISIFFLVLLGPGAFSWNVMLYKLAQNVPQKKYDRILMLPLETELPEKIDDHTIVLKKEGNNKVIAFWKENKVIANVTFKINEDDSNFRFCTELQQKIEKDFIEQVITKCHFYPFGKPWKLSNIPENTQLQDKLAVENGIRNKRTEEFDHKQDSLFAYLDSCAWALSCDSSVKLLMQQARGYLIQFYVIGIVCGALLPYGVARYQLLNPQNANNVQHKSTELQEVPPSIIIDDDAPEDSDHQNLLPSLTRDRASRTGALSPNI